jgi:hypothetical protein
VGVNAWLRRNPLLLVLLGAVVGVVGAVRGQPIAIAVGVVVVLFGLARALIG